MDLRELRQYLDQLTSSLEPEEHEILQARLRGLVSVFPFSEYEFILMFLRDREVISFEDYEKLRDILSALWFCEKCETGNLWYN
jgi:hypothetical protein